MKRKKVYSTKRRKNKGWGNPDKYLLGVIALLLLFGLIAIYDATVILAQDLYGNAYRFVVLQLAWIFIGLLAFLFFYRINLQSLRKLSKLIFAFVLVVLFVLSLFGVLPCDSDFIFAPCINGANRWFYLNPPPLPKLPIVGILGFQPSELAKFSLIIFLAAVLEKISDKKTSWEQFVSFLVVTGAISVLIVLQPNLSTATLIFAIGTVMYFTSDADLKPMFVTFPALGVLALSVMMSFEHTRARIFTFLGQSESAELSSGYHIKQILISLGSGGLTGVGIGQSRQKFDFLPEVFADSIFAIIGEELGFVGTTLLVIAFAFLVYRGFAIAKKAPDIFSRLLAVGVTSWIALQFFVNVGAMTRLLPLTGIPLPLISYGGSSLVFMLMGLGVLANVSRQK